jgi:hypothetical protein
MAYRYKLCAEIVLAKYNTWVRLIEQIATGLYYGPVYKASKR